jgi:hypothetical protein
MTDIPSRDALIEAGARALCHLDGGNWRISNDAWSGILYREAAAAALDALIPLVLAGAGEALRRFASVADDYDDSEDDELQVLEDTDFLVSRLPLGAFRRARAALAQINTLIGESKGTDTDTKGTADER